MAVIYDSSAAGLQTSGVVSLTFSFDNVSGSALVIGVGGNWPNSSKPSSSGAFITYGGVKFVKTFNNVETGDIGYIGGYLMDPATGPNDIIITMQSSTGVTWLNAVVMSVSGPTGTPQCKVSYTANSLVSTRTIIVDSQTTGVVASIALLGGAANGNTSWSCDSQSTQQIAASYVSPWVLKGSTKPASSPSTTVSWTNNDGTSIARTSAIMAFAFPPRDTALSPTYYYNFQNDTIGYMANEFTAYGDWLWGSTLDVRAVPGETTQKALSIIKGSYGMEHIYNSRIGKLTLNDQPIEIATKFKFQFRSNTTLVDTVSTDFMTVGIMLENGDSTGIGVSLRYGYADEFRIQSYQYNSAYQAIAFRPWKITGALTFTTSSNIVTGVIDPIIPPYNYNFTDYPNYFTTGTNYQIIDLGSDTDWNAIVGTTNITYNVGDIILVANKGTGGGRAVRKTATRFQAAGNDAADKGMAVGATLYTMDGTEIGVIQSIESATSLTLTTNAKTNGTVVQAKLHPDSFIPKSNTWYYIRFRRDTDGTYKAKVWPATATEPDLWLLDSTPEKGQYNHNQIDQLFTTGRLGVTAFASGGNNFYWDQWGVSLDGGVASLDGTFPPSITSVDGDNIITSAQTNVDIIGYHLVGTASAAIIQGTTSIPQTVTINSETSATFNVAFDTDTYDVKYGTAVLRLISATGGIGNKTITIIPPDGRCYRDLTSVNDTAENRITALPDLAIGDQIEVVAVSGGQISDVNINPDGTFDALASVTSFTCRAWSSADQSWGNVGIQAMVASAIRRRIIIVS